MTEERDWKEAKPKWIVDAAKAEMKAIKERLALRWPDESRPPSMDFWWGEYDKLSGNPVAGQYFKASLDGYVSSVEIRGKNASDKGWREWRFRYGTSATWTDSVARGPLYETETEAYLACLWMACDDAAETLSKRWAQVHKSRGYV